jgi:hypothetical protein
MAKLTDRVVRSGQTAAEATADDTLVLDLRTGRYFGMGEVGGFIWERLDGEQTLEEIARATAAHFAVEPSRAAADLLDFVAQLLGAGLARELAA